MNKIIKNILKIIGIYAGYLILTLIIFYFTGMYVWNQAPTKLVLMRILVFPILLTLITLIVIWLIKKMKK